MAACVEALEVVAYDDLGTESIKRLTVRDLPLTVALDAQGAMPMPWVRSATGNCARILEI